MFKRSSDGSIKGIIISMIALLALGGFAFAADTWNLEDEEHFESDNLHTGAQLAVAEVLFLPKVGQEASTLLIAITDGEDKVRIYSFSDESLPPLSFEDEVTVVVSGINTPVAWTPTFMDLDIDQGGDESCLVSTPV